MTQDEEDEGENDNPIEEEQILEIAQNIDMTDLKKQVMDLFKINYEISLDPELFFQKMSFLFLQKPPVD